MGDCTKQEGMGRGWFLQHGRVMQKEGGGKTIQNELIQAGEHGRGETDYFDPTITKTPLVQLKVYFCMVGR